MAGTFEVYEDKAGKFRFRLKAGNGEVVASGEAYEGAFPELFTDIDQMPATLRGHLRYPEDLFRVQTNVWGRYHINESTEFYQTTNGWNVAKDPGSTVNGATQTVTTMAGLWEIEADHDVGEMDAGENEVEGEEDVGRGRVAAPDLARVLERRPSDAQRRGRERHAGVL